MPARKKAPKNLTEEARLAKNEKIRAKGMATRERRAGMKCAVRDLKIVTNKLNRTQEEALNRVFLESKWLRNAALANERFDASYATELAGVVPVRLPDGSLEERKLKWLGSQMQQAAVTQLARDRKALAAKKKKGGKVGRLKFAREVKSIDLQQFGVTWRFKNEGHRQVKVQNIPGWLYVRGFEQLEGEGVEFANAKLLKLADGWHLKVTTYIPVEASTGEETSASWDSRRKRGVDGGVKTAFTFEDGKDVNALVEETDRLRRHQRKARRKKKGSNGEKRHRQTVVREYKRVSDKKDDIARKLVHEWTRDAFIFFQDERLAEWKRRDGAAHGSRKVHHGVMGRVKVLLKKSPNAFMLPKWVKTTQWCRECCV